MTSAPVGFLCLPWVWTVWALKLFFLQIFWGIWASPYSVSNFSKDAFLIFFGLPCLARRAHQARIPQDRSESPALGQALWALSVLGITMCIMSVCIFIMPLAYRDSQPWGDLRQQGVVSGSLGTECVSLSLVPLPALSELCLQTQHDAFWSAKLLWSQRQSSSPECVSLCLWAEPAPGYDVIAVHVAGWSVWVAGDVFPSLWGGEWSEIPDGELEHSQRPVAFYW